MVDADQFKVLFGPFPPPEDSPMLARTLAVWFALICAGAALGQPPDPKKDVPPGKEGDNRPVLLPGQMVGADAYSHFIEVYGKPDQEKAIASDKEFVPAKVLVYVKEGTRVLFKKDPAKKLPTWNYWSASDAKTFKKLPWPEAEARLAGRARYRVVSAAELAAWRKKLADDEDAKRAAVAAAEKEAALEARRKLIRPGFSDVSMPGRAGAALLGDIEVSIMEVTLGQTPLKDFGATKSEKDYLNVKIRLSTSKPGKRFSYSGWTQPLLRSRLSLTDDLDNSHPEVTFFPASVVGQRPNGGSFYTDEPLYDVLVFARPVREARFLFLELPGREVGHGGTARLQIPVEMVKR